MTEAEITHAETFVVTTDVEPLLEHIVGLLATIAETSAQQVTLLESILRKLERIERSQYA
jgi:hypothetical protein